MRLQIVARTEADAGVEHVWEILRSHAGWTRIDRLLTRVEGAALPLEAGQQLRLVVAGPVRLPCDVRVVHPLRRLGVSVRPLPGAIADIDVHLLPLPRGRTDIEARVALHGPTAPLAYAGARLLAFADVRSLAAEARSART